MPVMVKGSNKETLVFRKPELNRSKTPRVEAALRRLTKLEIDSKDLFNLVLCVSELLDNATKKNEQFPATLELSMDGNKVKCTVKDSGRHFQTPSIALPKKEYATNGRGLFLVHQISEGTLEVDGNRNTASFSYEISRATREE